MGSLDWLVARPVAHRGLHDAQAGIIENTPSAFSTAVAAGYGIECDLQVTADGEAMVHHDAVLGRLTEGSGRLDAMSVAALKLIAFKTTSDRMITLGELCDLVGGRTTLLIEMKSRYDGDRRLVARAADVLSIYRGAAALMSFDPAQVAALAAGAPSLARGIVAEAMSQRGGSGRLYADAKRSLAYLGRMLRARPQFLAYAVKDLPATLPWMARRMWKRPLLAWTVRTPAERHTAERFADQIIFEGFRP